ncbi:MAG: SCP2 sterol-binding domain-containing protein [Deltaproteobacteria bacterium]|nr:SCP2 sterol-binding domain-containing protein [Deltaproteobacteria bacterium]MBW2256434.1 SCP2 sterol-binding domain-containing protein [Deltaproteobacteria bacterium]
MADLQNFFSTYLPKKLQDHPELSEEINDSYQFDIEGAGQWCVDLTKTPGEVSEGPMEEPGCVVTAEAEDFETLLDNPASGMMLFTMGKLKVTNVGLALSLQKILG